MEYQCRYCSLNILKKKINKNKKCISTVKLGDSIGYWTNNFHIPYRTLLGNKCVIDFEGV